MVHSIKYKLPVVESVLDWTHGFYRYIREIYIPEFKIAFNEAGYVFTTNEDRYRDLELPNNKIVKCEILETIELEDEDIDVLRKYLNTKENIKKIIEKYFGKIDK
jgi:predicted RNA methylase